MEGLSLHHLGDAIQRNLSRQRIENHILLQTSHLPIEVDGVTDGYDVPQPASVCRNFESNFE